MSNGKTLIAAQESGLCCSRFTITMALRKEEFTWKCLLPLYLLAYPEFVIITSWPLISVLVMPSLKSQSYPTSLVVSSTRIKSDSLATTMTRFIILVNIEDSSHTTVDVLLLDRGRFATCRKLIVERALRQGD